jgi:hypothetical protein
VKSAVGQTLLSVASQNQEAVQERSEKIVPVIFFAMHLKKSGLHSNICYYLLYSYNLRFDMRVYCIKCACLYIADGTNDQFIELWNEVWNDVIGSMEVALSKHKTAIIEFLRQSFSSPSWNIKTQVSSVFYV